MSANKSKRPLFFSNPQSLAEAVLSCSPACDLITFDLFDTLLIRRVDEPDRLKEAVARYTAERARQMGIACDQTTVLAARAKYEKRQRQLNSRQYPDAEAVYPDFMSETLKEIFGTSLPENLLDDVTAFELQLESSMLVPRADLIDLLQKLHSRKISLWIMTDIYLPSGHIKVLLKNTGLLPLIDGVVSSADACLAKASGAGFRDLRSRLKIDPRKWAHVGDNPFSDGLRPAEFGIAAFVLKDSQEAHRKFVCGTYYRAAHKKRFWRGRLWQQLALPLEGERFDLISGRQVSTSGCKDYGGLYSDGYNFFGPLITAFIAHIAEQAKIRGLKNIYFFSREGYILQRVWEILAPSFFSTDKIPQAHYLEVSRLALAPATCAHNGLTQVNARIALLPAGSRDLRDICRVFGLQPDVLEPFFKKHNLEPHTPLKAVYHSNWTNAVWLGFEALLKDLEFQAAVRQQTQNSGLLLESYLEAKGFFDHPEAAVVDIGWLGTIQRFLFEAVAHREDCPALHGFLLAATRGIPYPAKPTNNIEGFIFDRDRLHGASGFITNALDVFEEACREPAPGVTGYTLDQGQIKAIRMEENEPARQAEARQDVYYAPLQQGILDFARRGVPALTVLGYTSADLLPWLQHLVFTRFAFPTAREVKRLSYCYHLDEYAGKHKVPWRLRWHLSGLWEIPPALLKYIPGIRSFYFFKNIAGRLLLRLKQTLYSRNSSA